MPTDPESNYATQWPVRHHPRDVIDLLARVLDCAPKLDGAACRDMPPQIFDADQLDQAAQAAQALEVCEACPALQACSAWADSGHIAPVGILAGRWYLDDHTGSQARRLQTASKGTRIMFCGNARADMS